MEKFRASRSALEAWDRAPDADYVEAVCRHDAAWSTLMDERAPWAVALGYAATWGKHAYRDDLREVGLTPSLPSLGARFLRPTFRRREIPIYLVASFYAAKYAIAVAFERDDLLSRAEVPAFRALAATAEKYVAGGSRERAAFLRAAASVAAKAEARVAPSIDGNPSVAAVAFAYPRLVANARAATYLAVSTGFVPLEYASDEEAPVAWRLPVAEWHLAAGAPATLDVRRIDGVLFRPVLAPCSWTPCDLRTFLSACNGGEPWRDSPFEEPLPHSTVSLSARAVEAPDPGGRDAEARDSALGDATARCGRLLVVDGIVHRETTPPTFHVACGAMESFAMPSPADAEVNRKDARLAWRLRGLAMGDRQSPLPVEHGKVVDWLGDANGHAWEERRKPAAFLAFPDDALDVALDALDTFAKSYDVQRVDLKYEGPPPGMGTDLEPLLRSSHAGACERHAATAGVARNLAAHAACALEACMAREATGAYESARLGESEYLLNIVA